jgi:hypothetical protein
VFCGGHPRLGPKARAGLDNLFAIGRDDHPADTWTINHALPDMLDEVLACLASQDLSGESPRTQTGWNNDRGCPLRCGHSKHPWQS